MKAKLVTFISEGLSGYCQSWQHSHLLGYSLKNQDISGLSTLFCFCFFFSQKINQKHWIHNQKYFDFWGCQRFPKWWQFSYSPNLKLFQLSYICNLQLEFSFSGYFFICFLVRRMTAIQHYLKVNYPSVR